MLDRWGGRRSVVLFGLLWGSSFVAAKAGVVALLINACTYSGGLILAIAGPFLEPWPATELSVSVTAGLPSTGVVWGMPGEE